MATHPPLRIREEDGSPNTIPVFDLIVSNGTLTQLGGGKARLATGGAGGGSGAPTDAKYAVLDFDGDLSAELRLVQSGNSISITTGSNLITISATTSDVSGLQASLTIPLEINSGGTGLTAVTSATDLLGFNSSDITKVDGYSLAASDNMTIIRLGNEYRFSATTSGAAGGGGDVSVARILFNSNNLTSGGSGSLTVSHGLAQQFVMFQLYDSADKLIFPDDFTCTSTGTSNLDLTNYGVLTSSWNLVVMA